MAKARRKRGRPRSVGTLNLMEYAVAGARMRVQELAREAGALFRHFPQLRTERLSSLGGMAKGMRRRGRGSRAVGTTTAAGPSSARPAGRRRRKLSPEARARISAAQTRRWAAQRKKVR